MAEYLASYVLVIEAESVYEARISFQNHLTSSRNISDDNLLIRPIGNDKDILNKDLRLFKNKSEILNKNRETSDSNLDRLKRLF